MHSYFYHTDNHIIRSNKFAVQDMIFEVFSSQKPQDFNHSPWRLCKRLSGSFFLLKKASLSLPTSSSLVSQAIFFFDSRDDKEGPFLFQSFM